jgi:hypothetical protein
MQFIEKPGGGLMNTIRTLAACFVKASAQLQAKLSEITSKIRHATDIDSNAQGILINEVPRKLTCKPLDTSQGLLIHPVSVTIPSNFYPKP